jgi:hypothetical protein
VGGSGGEEKSRGLMCKGGKVGKWRGSKKNADKKPGKSKIKAVMFVPYMHGSKLAKQLREIEETMEGITGYRMKIVERGGRKLSHMLHKSNTWEGKPCTRQNCLHCDTKLRKEKFNNQSCHKRNNV